MTILYVDDDQDDKEIFNEALNTLRKSDLELIMLSTGEEVLKHLGHTNTLPNVLVVDLNLVGCLSGYCVIKALRQNSRYRDLPIVAFTTSRFPDHQNQAIADGATECITKPSNFRLLCKDIETLIEKYS
jgi:CheY-like chemotaxis protein